jgi:flagellar motor switch protein FliN
MTTLQSATDTLESAAAAVCAVLPAVSPLSPGRPSTGTATAADAFAGAAIADFEGLVPGALAVLVGSDLVQALEASPLGSLDLAAAAQPALDAAAEALGGRVGAARTVGLDLVVNDLGGPFTVVPLEGTGGSAALLVSDSTLTGSKPGPVAFQPPPVGPAPSARGLEMLHGVIMDVTVELGRTRMSVRELLALTPGTVLELDRAAGSPADLLVNGRLIARGEVVVVDEDFGLRVTEIVDDSATS